MQSRSIACEHVVGAEMQHPPTLFPAHCGQSTGRLGIDLLSRIRLILTGFQRSDRRRIQKSIEIQLAHTSGHIEVC